MTNIIVPERAPLDFEQMGVGRGWSQGKQYVKEFAQKSKRLFPRVLFTDFKPGAAEGAAIEAIAGGITAVSREADILSLGPDQVAPLIVMQIDDSMVALAGIRRFVLSSILFHMLIRTNNDWLFAIHANIHRDDAETREAVALLLEAVAANAIPSHSSSFFGEEGLTAHRDAEPKFREEIGRDLNLNREAFFLGAASPTPAITISMNGRKAIPVHVLDHRETGFENPALLAHERFENPNVRLRTGADELTAEIGPDSEVRLHTFRRRRSDGRVSVDGAEVLDPRTVTEKDAAKWERVIRERDQLLANAAANAITRKQPLMATD